MKKFSVKTCIVIDCVSFSAVTAILSALSLIFDDGEFFTPKFLLELLASTTAIATLMFFTSRLKIESRMMADLLGLFEVAAVILCMGGGLFHWFPWSLAQVAVTVSICTAVYFITRAVIILQVRDTAQKINQKIKERKNESDNRG